MKKGMAILVIVSFLVLPASVCFAVSQKNTGCGLGSVLFEGSNDSLLFQVFAATTNGTFGNQTFGITSGTSNCDQAKSFVSTERINTYVADNMDNLASDIAKGRGEYLNTLAVLMEVPECSRADFYTKLQTNFAQIYPSTEVSSVEVVKNIEALL